MSADPNPFAAKADFPDWLSPMLVKELRQGMRSRAFLFSFILLQVAMIFLALIGLLNASEHDSTESITVFFWIIICVPLGVILPSMALGAISSEKTGNTLEPIFLTQLTARRVLIGKWVAALAQILLLATAILPYAVLRYYLGSVDLIGELGILGWVVAGSALMVAMAIGISPAISRFGRVLLPVGAIIVLIFGISFLSDYTRMASRSTSSTADWWLYMMIIILGALLAAYQMEVGAGKIAPAAENHSTSKRLIALGAIAISVMYSYLPGNRPQIWIPVLVIAAFVFLSAICETVSEIPSVYRPFIRWGVPGRILGRFLYPGWPSGIFFILIIYGLVIWRLNHLIPSTASHRELIQTQIAEVGFLGMYMTPIAIYRLFNVKRITPFVFFISCQGLFALIAMFGGISSSYLHNGQTEAYMALLASVIPTCALCYSPTIGDWDTASQYFTLYGSGIVTALSILILLVKMWPAWRTITALERRATAFASTNLPPANPPTDVAQPATPA